MWQLLKFTKGTSFDGPQKNLSNTGITYF
jgi:hypothetical protein